MTAIDVCFSYLAQQAELDSFCANTGSVGVMINGTETFNGLQYRNSIESFTVFFTRRCTGGGAHCSTEFMPGNSSQMILFHKCVKCALKRAHMFGVYFSVNESRLSENDP